MPPPSKASSSLAEPRSTPVKRQSSLSAFFTPPSKAAGKKLNKPVHPSKPSQSNVAAPSAQDAQVGQLDLGITDEELLNAQLDFNDPTGLEAHSNSDHEHALMDQTKSEDESIIPISGTAIAKTITPLPHSTITTTILNVPARADTDMVDLQEVTKMAKNLVIGGGVAVTNEQVRSAMKTQIRVAVPSTPTLKSNTYQSATEPERDKGKETISNYFAPVKSVVSQPTPQSAVVAAISAPVVAQVSKVVNDIDTIPTSTSAKPKAPHVAEHQEHTLAKLDSPTKNTLTDEQPFSAPQVAIVPILLEPPVLTPTPSVLYSDSAHIDRKRRRIQNPVNYSVSTALGLASDDDEDMDTLTHANAKKSRKTLTVDSDSDEYVLKDDPDDADSSDDHDDSDSDVGSPPDDGDDMDFDVIDPAHTDDTQIREAFLKADVESDDDDVVSEPDVIVKKQSKSKAKPKAAPAKPSWEVRNESVSHGIEGIAPGKGPDFSLAPLKSIETIFDDMVLRTTEFDHGLKEAAEQLRGTTLRVATMCSGTESPLLALSLINSSLEMMGLPPIKVDHQFSAEIEPFKQAYIDRNFRVPILFRDVVEMARSGCTRATTAYGSLVDIPGEVDMLVVGFSCVDYSNLNNFKKSMEEMGQSGATFKAVLTYATTRKPKVIVVENVDGAEWDKIKQCFNNVGYAARHVRVDTKLYYLPQTRCRGYMICLLKEVYGNSAEATVEKWASMMERMKRKTSASFRDFVLPDDDHRIRKAQWERAEASGNTILWEACQGRHEAERITERLGRKRELLKWVDGGSCIAPEYVDKAWLGRMPERVWDLMELLNLKSALRHDIDFQFKSQVFDLSQNPDRINQVCPSGLASCVTPRGMLYVGDKGRCLTGYEMLSLQGIPIDRISLSHETDDELRDLAGNAMTSTVVGAAIIGALSVAWKGLKKTKAESTKGFTETIHDSLALALPANLSTEMTSSTIISSLRSTSLSTVSKSWTPWSPSSLTAMLSAARLSARMCYCEGMDAVTHHAIQMCRLCGHSTCVQCGKRPTHDYKVWRGGRVTVQQWRRQWAGGWPVQFSVRNDLLSSNDADMGTDLRSSLQTHMAHALDAPLSLVHFRRGPVWRVEYESPTARLEIYLNPSCPMMYLFVKPERHWPADDSLRLLVEKWPVARAQWPAGMNQTSQPLNGNAVADVPCDWKWLELPKPPKGAAPAARVPPHPKGFAEALGMKPKTITPSVVKDAISADALPRISIKSRSIGYPSARSRLGLLDSANQVQPSELIIDASKHDITIDADERVGGRYVLLPECGTAFASLYKRISPSLEPDQPSPPPSDFVTGDEVYLLLESTSLGNGANDRFAFTRHCGRFEYGDVRPVLAVLDKVWRPWLPPKGAGASSKQSTSTSTNPDAVLLDWEWSATLSMPGRYISQPTSVTIPEVPLGVKVWTPETEAISAPVISEIMPDQTCLRPVPLLTLRLSLPDASKGLGGPALAAITSSRHGVKKQYALSDSTFSTIFGWAFLALHTVSGLGEWHGMDIAAHSNPAKPNVSTDGQRACACLTCAPPKPTIRWCPKPGRGLAKAALKGLKAGKGTAQATAMAAGTGGQLMPTEDAREAGEYEARIKALPEKVVAWVGLDSATSNSSELNTDFGVHLPDEGAVSQCTLTISASLSMMAHQAVSRLLTDTLKIALCQGTVDAFDISAAWRVETDYIPCTSSALPPFVLSSNVDDSPSSQPDGFLLPLRLDQRRSLAWMRHQEGSEPDNEVRGTTIDSTRGIPFEVFDADESCAPSVNWRVEVRARAKVWVRGGVVADQVSYGKTVTALALIHGDHGENGVGADKMDLAQLVPAPNPSMVKTKATLVVCPRHLTAQWRSEIVKFLPYGMYNKPGAVLEITSPAQLLATPGRDIANAKIVILSWDVLAHDIYIDAIVGVLGADSDPPSRAGRAFADFCDGVADRIVEVCGTLGETEILNSGNDITKPTRGRAAAKSASAKSGRIPTLVQFFHFRRIIVDEFSYLAEHKGTKPGIFAQLASLSTTSRWLLSGTPPLASFADIDRMARLLGFSLGSQLPTPADLRAVGRDQHSKTEIFSAFQQTRSPTWHADRHSLAQKFLRVFVRQNEARLDDPDDGVSCFNYIVPLKLAPVHRAVYLELAQHVNAVDMKLKKANDSSDRSGRLNRSLAGCTTAEEALLNCASASDPKVTVYTVLRAREQGVREIRAEVKSKIDKAAEMKYVLKGMDSHFDEWRQSILRNSIGDPAVTGVFRTLFKEGDKAAKASSSKNNSKPTDKVVLELRALVISLRILTKEVTMRMRSLRFLRNVRSLADLANQDQDHTGSTVTSTVVNGTTDAQNPSQSPACSNPSCTCHNVPLKQLLILSFCGHMVCTTCNSLKSDAESCPVDGCAAHSHENAVVTLSDLIDDDPRDSSVTTARTAPTQSFGAKLDHAADLILSLPADERALLFVPTDALAQISARMCKARGIVCAVVDSSYNPLPVTAPTGTAASRAKNGTVTNNGSPTSAITAFLAPKSNIQVLILNHSSESAAGTNLVRANHVLFLSPTLSPSQQAYEARMRQAIGRARRYGQKLPVHVYLYAACRTIDADVWEMRERRGVVVHQVPKRKADGSAYLPEKVNGFVRPGVRRAHAYEYFPPELSLPIITGGDTTEQSLDDLLPPLEPVRLARVRWQGKDEIALVPRGVLDRYARAEIDADAMMADASIVEEEAANDDGDSMMHDCLSEAVTRSNAVEPVGTERFTSLIKFSATFQSL